VPSYDEAYEAKQQLERLYGSTTYSFKVVKMPKRPAGQKQRSEATSARSKLWARDCRRPLQIVIQYRGGNLSRWEVQARGKTWSFPWYYPVGEMMQEICRWSWGGQEDDWLID